MAEVSNGSYRLARYCDDIISGKRPSCKWTQLAVERHLRDLDRWRGKDQPFRFSEEKANRVIEFKESLRHVKGEWAARGETLKLEDWQCFNSGAFFGWLRADGFRRFRTGYTEVPRKNAKSTDASGTALYALAADGEAGAEVYSAATTRDQAKIVFRDAQAMCRKDPDLREALGIEVLAHNINIVNSDSKFEALSAEGETLDGLNVHCAIVDELHAHPTRDVWDVLETATGARRQSIIWAVTTAGSNRAGICYEQRTYLTRILQRLEGFEDDSYFGVIHTIDDGDAWHEPDAWRKANPNYGVSVMPDDLERKARKALALPSAQNNFLTKHLNVWVASDIAWTNMQAWERNKDTSLKIEDFAGQPCWIGLDLASKQDIAAKVIVFRRNADYYVFGKYYLPEDTIEESGNSQYRGWVRSGRLTATDGNVTDYEEIARDLMEDHKRFQVKATVYDRFQATFFSTEMAKQGIEMTEYNQTVGMMSEPTKTVEALNASGKLHTDGCPLLAWMASNVVAHFDAKENVYPKKERAENKIDGYIALVMAVGAALRTPEATSFAFYEL